MKIEGTLNLVPMTATHQQKKARAIPMKNGRNIISFYDPPNVKLWRKTLSAYLLPYKPRKPLEGPLLLEVAVIFPWRKSELKRDMVNGWNYHFTKPDAGNWSKLLEDVMETLSFFRNDSQIASLVVHKFRGDSPCIKFSIQELNTQYRHER